jgi:integral membrane protein
VEIACNKKKMKNIFRIVGFLEGLSYILLLFIATPIKYAMGDPSYVKLLGMPHGLLFVAYIILACMLKVPEKWNTKTFGIVLIASLLPFATFYIDKKYLRKEH